VPNSPILHYLESLHVRHRELTSGAVADYIPELARVDPDRFGICIATHEGYVYEVGDTRRPFTIQSVSKPLTYGLELEQNGEAAVLAKIGVEPSGDAFNAISLQPQTGAPFNPLINAGAIAACGLIKGNMVEAKTGVILDTFSRYAGRELDVDEQVYASESATGHRNRASAGCCAISIFSATSRRRRWKRISVNAQSASPAAILRWSAPRLPMAASIR